MNGFYDACYLALAELFDCPLATFDSRPALVPGLRCQVQLVEA